MILQLMVASGYIPLAWIYNNYPEQANTIRKWIIDLWYMMLDINNLSSSDKLLPFLKSFGMLTVRMDGHSKEKLMYFVIAEDTPSCKAHLEQVVNKYHIHDLLVLNNNEYSAYLVDMNYTFLFKFDKIVTMNIGTTFKFTSELIKRVPTLLAQIGCNGEGILTGFDTNSEDEVVNPMYIKKEFLQGQTIQFTVSVASNKRIGYICINGVPYFNGTSEMDGAGILITEGKTLVTSYKEYTITISGLNDSSKIYVQTCADWTGKSSYDKMISTEFSKVEFGEDYTRINIVFNNPFIFLDENKIKVYGKKDDESEEELIENFGIIITNNHLVENKATFGYVSNTKKSTGYIGSVDFMDIYSGEREKYHHHHWDNGLRIMPVDVVNYLPGRHRPPIPNPHLKKPYPTGSKVGQNVIKEALPSAIAMLYYVNECGSLMITFNGYSDYKYFRVAFEDRAMITSYRVPSAIDYSVLVIPVIEDFNIVRPDNEETSTAPDKESSDDDI